MFGGCLQCRWDMCPACRAAPAGRVLGTRPKSAPRTRAAPASPGHRPRPSVAPPTTPPQLHKRDLADNELDVADDEAELQPPWRAGAAASSSSAGPLAPPWRQVDAADHADAADDADYADHYEPAGPADSGDARESVLELKAPVGQAPVQARFDRASSVEAREDAEGEVRRCVALGHLPGVNFAHELVGILYLR